MVRWTLCILVRGSSSSGLLFACSFLIYNSIFYWVKKNKLLRESQVTRGTDKRRIEKMEVWCSWGAMTTVAEAFPQGELCAQTETCSYPTGKTAHFQMFLAPADACGERSGCKCACICRCSTCSSGIHAKYFKEPRRKTKRKWISESGAAVPLETSKKPPYPPCHTSPCYNRSAVLWSSPLLVSIVICCKPPPTPLLPKFLKQINISRKKKNRWNQSVYKCNLQNTRYHQGHAANL